MKRLVWMVVSILSLGAVSPWARADSVPPNAIECFGKSVGDACTVFDTHEPGHCEEGLCAKHRPDGSTIEPSGEYACRVCAPGAPSDGSCVIGRSGPVNRIGPWLLAGVVPLVLFFLRRRRR